LRGISDGKAELNHVSDWTEYLHIIDEKLAAAVDQLAQALSNGSLMPQTTRARSASLAARCALLLGLQRHFHPIASTVFAGIQGGIGAVQGVAEHLPGLMLADTDAQGHRGMQTVQAPVVPGHGLAYPLGDLGSLPGIR